MTKIKRWRLILAATLAAFFAVTLCFALQIGRSARAAEDGVLDGNTAEYTFENGTDTASQWVWHADTNEWLGEEGIYQMTEDKTSAVFTLTVTKSGAIAFEWKLGTEYPSNNRLHVVHHKSAENSDVDVVLLPSTKNEAYLQWNDVKVSDVEINDTLTFVYTKGGNNDAEQVWVRGLKKPSMDGFSIVATAGEGGTVKSNDTTSEIGGSITVDVPFGESFDAEAVASSGYVFTYWTDKNGNNISSNPKEQFFYAAGDVKANFVAESETVEVSFTFDTRYGKMYLLQNTEKANLKECIENGLPLEDDVPIKIKTGTTIVAGVECLETVQSTIDPLQTTSAVFGGWKDVVTPLDITYLGSTNPTQAFNIDQNGINYIWQSGSSWYTTKMEAKFKEIAPIPKVFYTATIDSASRGKAELHDKDNISLNFEQNNDILFEIEQNGFELNDKFALTINGESTPIVNDGDRCGFTLNGVNENKTIVITPDYGEKYLSTPIEFSISILLNKGIGGIVLDSSAPISVENDSEHPWYFDPARNRGDGYAFTSGISYLETITTPSFSQLKFTVTGNGSLTFEYHIDGYALSNKPDTDHNSWAAYSIDKKVDATKCTTGTTTGVDWRAYGGDGGGFKSTVATNLGYGNSYMDYKNVVTYYEPGIYGGTKIPDPEGAKESEKYWYKVNISIAGKQDTDQTDIYIAHAIGVSSKPLCANMTVRNVAFYKGNVNVNWAVNDVNGDAGDSSNKINVTGTEEPGSVAAGTTLEFTAVPAEGYTFYGWKNEAGKILSYNTTYKVTAGDGDLDVRGVFDISNTKAARIGDTFYEDLQSAIDAAKSGEDKKIIIVDNIKIASNLEIPADVSIIIPLDREGNFYKKNITQQPNIAWTNEELYKLWNVTVADSATLTIYGKLYVGGVLHSPDQSAQGHTSGAYSELVLDGNIIVAEGGMMDVYGRVTGKGGITVKSGGVLYQPFLILDYAGGNNTYDLFYLNQTPFKRYAMINIQCEQGYTIEYGGELCGHASLYFLSSVTTLDTQFISYVGSVQVNGAAKKGTTTLINLKEGASATGVYKDEKFVTSGGGNTANIGHTTLTISGGASAGYMNFLDMVQTDGVVFSIPYNYSLILQDGEYDMGYDYKLMPGASLTVEEGATLNLNAKFYVYDGLLQTKMSGKAYPTAAELTTAGYKTNGNFTVNGTLNINEGATFLGVVQTTNTKKTAKIVIADGATLSGKIVDGGETGYDCNYSEYESSARVWDKVHGTLATLTAGHTYVSTYVENDTFGIDAIQVTYEANDYGSAERMKGHLSHEEGANYATGNLEAVTGLKGAWMVEHEHTYDWTTPKEDEKSESIFKGGNSAEIERGCFELGCDEIEKKVLLKSLNTFNSKTYRGTEFTGAELFEELYSGRRAADVGATFTVKDDRLAKDVGTYTFTVALEKGYFLTADGTFEASHDFTFVIDRKNVTVSVQDQSSTYTGKEPDVKQGSYTISGLCGDDVLGIVIEKEPGTAAGEYRLTAKANSGANANGNYNIKFSYTASGHSTYTINKATLTVKPNNVSSPAGEEPITDFTSTISGFVNGEKGTLEAEIAEQLVYTCTVTKDSPSGRQYAITVKFTGELQNYEVKCESGSYTVTESLFKDVKFQDLVVTYDGTEHSLTVTGTEGLTGVKVEYAPANSYKNAGTYTVTATVTARDSAGKTYTQTYEATLTIERRTVTVELLAQTRVYDGTPASAQSRAGTDWKLADGSSLGAGDELSALGVALTVTAPTKNVGTYAISAVASVNDQQNGNYTVNFSNNNANLYTITKRDLHITVTEKTTVYGESIDLDQTAWTYDNDTDFIAGDLIHVTLSSDVKKDAGNYHITASADAALDDNKNYNFLFTDAAWTVSPKEITVVITPVSVTYSGQEPAAPTLWELKAGSELVTGDEKSALNIRLTKAAGVNAGSYDINAAYDNDNYTVTFEGGKGGYTVNKYDIGGAGDFFLMAGDEASTSGTFTLRYAGQTIELVGYVIFGEIVDLKVVLSQSSITEIGEYDVTASVDDINYSGSRTFRVIVVNGNGYTKHLVDTLAQLATLTDGMTAATLTAEDFGALKQAAALIAGLDESERETGKDALAPYESLIAAWNDAAADLDAKIETAESIQNALLGGIFGAAATLSLLLAAAYVVGKGGIL